MPAYPELLMSGMSNVVLQNLQYALPAFVCLVQSSVAVETSLDGTAWAALTGANTPAGAVTAATFLRCPTANALVVPKRYR